MAIKEADILSRFIHKSSEINWTIKKAKPSLFSDKHPRGFSVFETTDLSEKIITDIEITHIRSKRSDGKAPYGRCDMRVGNYKKAGLKIEEDNPPPRHYNIWGMPVKNDLTDADNLNIRQEMANRHSNLILYREKD